MIHAPVYSHDDVFSHPDCLVSLEDAGLEEFCRDTVCAAQEADYMDEDVHDTYH